MVLVVFKQLCLLLLRVLERLRNPSQNHLMMVMMMTMMMMMMIMMMMSRVTMRGGGNCYVIMKT